MIILNRNIKQEERFSDNEIFKLFSKKSYAKLTTREKVAFAKIVRECEESDIQELFDAKVVSKEGFLHLLGASPLAPFSPFGSNQTIIGLTMKKNLDYYMNLDYEIIVKKVKPTDGGGWFAYYKDFKGVMGDGESADEALQSAQESFKAFVTVALENREAILEPK